MAIVAISALGPSASAQQETATAVEPADLTRREDLVGKLIVVDDRVRFFQNHPRVGYDELYVKRTPLAFRLPAALRPESPPRNPAVIVQGRLTREGTRLYVDATALSLQPSDQERFDKGIAALPARDFEQRREWARWASKRARDFGDESLGLRAKAAETEALRIEAEAKRVTVDAPREWLSLAQQGRKRGVAEADTSALAHRAFRTLLASAATPTALEGLKSEIEAYFPAAAADSAAAEADLGSWAEKYDQDPAAAYRTAPAEVRKPLDRRLWADVVQRLLELQVSQDVQSSLKVVDEAARLVPDRPQLAVKLIDQAQSQARKDLTALRLAQVEAIGGLLSDRAKNPGAAAELYRDWLKSQRDHLSDTDAEGPVVLAGHYEKLLHDPEAGRQLLDRAWKIAPGSAMVTEAFKARGYRRVGEDWVKDVEAPEATAAAAPPTDVEQVLRNKTPAEVRAVMGVEPSSKTTVATKSRVILQWIYIETRQKRYVNFIYVPGSSNPRVASDFFLPL
ncbi:hypothetical protein [Paludisphaera mucosa]|uniref:Uncharacterized protein n=1 Tax=Paludisphaera mucosa TaxID=3030827 RepID=A0ABT6F6C4_9BACT|nr:hypothetical protein [Paludisphaera mucosa]MDG3002935.1 hypothetical protein [Paludisphaera mucosa]